ncbi:aldo/keto reductase, partial [Marinitenerispora sediminis]
QPHVASTTVGPRTAAQLGDVLAAEGVVLPREIHEASVSASSPTVR